MPRLTPDESPSERYEEWPSKFYMRHLGDAGLLTREGELKLARKRDRGWALGRCAALAGVNSGRLIDEAIRDHRQRRVHQRRRELWELELERLLHWREVHRRCRRAAVDEDWAEVSAALDELRPAIDAIPFDQRQWQPMVTAMAKTLAVGLALHEDQDAWIARIEQRIGHPYSSWVDLSMAIVEGEREAKRAIDELIAANLRLVIFVARRFRHQSRMAVADLVQEGNIGLMCAAERFDARRGLRFATFALWWIRQGITRNLGNLGRTVRIPISALSQLARVTRTRREFDSREGREPTPQELAAMVGVSAKRIEFLLSVDHDPLSLHTPLGEDLSLGDTIEDTQAPDLDEHIHELETSWQAHEMLNELDDWERQVIERRFGFTTDEQTPEQIAEELEITPARVEGLEADAIEKLRRAWGC